MNIYTLEKFEKNLKWEYSLFMKECENLTLAEHLLLGRYLKHEIGYTQFFLKQVNH